MGMRRDYKTGPAGSGRKVLLRGYLSVICYDRQPGKLLGTDLGHHRLRKARQPRSSHIAEIGVTARPWPGDSNACWTVGSGERRSTP